MQVPQHPCHRRNIHSTFEFPQHAMPPPHMSSRNIQNVGVAQHQNATHTGTRRQT
jgi:hypothetical protein